MFKSMSHGGNNFTKDKNTYGVDDKTKLVLSQKQTTAFGNYKRVNHDYKFKPARKGYGDPLGRYPEYIKPRERTQTEPSEKTKTEGDERGDWKHTYKGLSRPTPSISLMGTNCRKYL